MSIQEPYPGYKSMSSVAQALLPRAEKMHREGMTWRQIAQELKVSHTALHIWRKLRETRETSLGLRDTQIDARAGKGSTDPATPGTKNLASSGWSGKEVWAKR